ncbi:unnamed protein product, partial [Laminaria digitata]
CCLAHVRRDGTLLRLSKQATLQFVVVKPTMSVLGLIALAAGQYFAGPFQVRYYYFCFRRPYPHPALPVRPFNVLHGHKVAVDAVQACPEVLRGQERHLCHLLAK